MNIIKLSRALEVEIPKAPKSIMILGDLSGNVKADNQGNVYVHYINSAFPKKVYNNTVPVAAYGRKVYVGKKDGSNKEQVIGFADSWPGNLFVDPLGSEVTEHNHTWGESGNPAYMRDENIVTFNLSPINGQLVVQLIGGPYWLDDGWHLCRNQDIDMTSDIPAAGDGANWVLIEVDVTGTIVKTPGDPFASRDLLTIENLPALNPDNYFIGAIKVYEGQITIRKNRKETDIFNPKFSTIGNFQGGGGLPTLDADRLVATDPTGLIATYPGLRYDSILNYIIMGEGALPFSPLKNDHVQIGEGDSVGRWELVLSDALTDSAFDTVIRGGGLPGVETKVLDGMVFKRVLRARGFYDSVGGISDTQGEIRVVADGDWSSTSQPVRFEFWGTPVGSDTAVLYLTIKSNGDIDIASGKAYLINGAAIPHTTLGSIGTNSHATIDTHLASATKHSQLFLMHNLSGTIPTGATYYGYPGVNTLVAALGGAFVPRSGKLKNLFIRTNSAQPGTGSLVVTMQIGLVNTTLTFTVAAGGAAGYYVDTTHAPTFAAGDVITITVKNNAGSASATINSFGFDIEWD